MTTAVGGTAGPPTGHMVISARSKSIHGPWQNSPYNPITPRMPGAATGPRITLTWWTPWDQSQAVMR